MAKKYIPKLYDSDEVTLIDDIHDVIECKIREERNGIFELTLDYPASSPLLYEFKKERIIVANASPKLRNQMFVVYKVCRYMKKKIKVIARHISFDLLYDSCSELKLENASCEYVLNSLFRNSRFSHEFRGFSDIINAQNYSIENVNILEAIAGKEGSIIDTFGTGAEILRDNKNFHVLNKRGHDNGVSIEYGINLTGFECYEDTTDLVTCIRPFAIYRKEDSTEITVRGDFIDSPRAGNYKHLYIKHIDYTNKFEAKEVPTPDKLNELAAQDFRTSSIDIPKMRYEIKFIPLSQCAGYENFQDAIGLCDIVTVKNRVYNVNDKAKVVATVFDPIKDRYESMELGEPRSTLGSILSGSDGKDGQNGKDGKDGKDGQDGNVENMPDTLPETPILYSKVYGMGGLELSWSFENKLYYNYELYASRIPDFNPTAFDLIYSGQSSSHFFKANPGETWYFRVCAINSHSKRTPFSNQVVITLPKAEDMNNYFSEMAIGKAVVQSLSADYMEAGIIKAHWVEFKGMSIVDGNGVRTIDVDTFGRVALNVTKLQISSKNVATTEMMDDKANKETLITEINIAPGITKIKSNKLDIEGATTIGDGNGNYVKVNKFNYEAYCNHVQTMYWGGWQENGNFLPVMYMGAAGFDASSSGPSGTYFLMKSFSTYHDLSHRSRLNGKFSIMRFHEGGDIVMIPIDKFASEGLIQARRGMEILNEYALELKDWNGNVRGRISRGVFELSQIKSIDGTLIQFKDSLRCMTYGNTCGTDDGRWGTIFLSRAPDISSDKSLKDNIRYIKDKPSSIKKRSLVVVEDEEITIEDMSNFVKNDFKPAQYRYKEHIRDTIGFVADDIKDNKVGKKIVHENSDGLLSYDDESLKTVMFGALKAALNKIDALENKLELVESELKQMKEGV